MSTMPKTSRPAAAGFHAGELAMQRRAGVEAEAARLTSMVGPAQLRGGMAAFLADRTFAVLSARDPAGWLWASSQVGLIAVEFASRQGRRRRSRPAGSRRPGRG
jgi:hypothetical protein